MITPTDEQVEELRKLHRTLEMQANIMRDAKRTGGWEGSEKVAAAFERAAEKVEEVRAALTAAFSLAAPAGTVEVSEDDKAAIREYATRGSPYRHATLAHSNFVVCVERIALAWIEEQRSALLPPQPSAQIVPTFDEIWQRIGADPLLAHARKVLSIHEIRTILQHTRGPSAK